MSRRPLALEDRNALDASHADDEINEVDRTTPGRGGPQR